MTGVRPEAQPHAPSRRRRIDRLISEDYLTGLEGLVLATLRARRREAEQEDSNLTYWQALVRGRVEIVRAELARRETAAPAGTSLVAQLPEILGAGLRGELGSGRFPRVQPDVNVLDKHRRLEDKVLAESAVADLTTISDQDLSTIVTTLVEFDSVLSSRRSRVRDVVDALSGELTRRYRNGEAKVDDLLLGPDVAP